MRDARSSAAIVRSPAHGGSLAPARRPWRRRGLALSFAALLGAIAPARTAEACSIFDPICWVEEAVDFIADTLEEVAELTISILTLDPAGVFDSFQDMAENVLCGGLTVFSLAGGNIAEEVHDSCTSSHPIEPAVLAKLGTYFKSSFAGVTIHENCNFSSPFAITFGENIYFGTTNGLSNYHPLCASGAPCDCRDGLDTLGFSIVAHELMHVLQYRKEGFADFICQYFSACSLTPWALSATGQFEMTVGLSCGIEQTAYVYQALVLEDVRRDGDGIFTCPLGECDDEGHELNVGNVGLHSCNAEILRCGLVLEGQDVPNYCAFTDNCPDVANPDQTDSDGDGRGDACDTCASSLQPFEDLDDDCVLDTADNCPCDPAIVSAVQDVCNGDNVPVGITPPGACFPSVGCAEFANTDQADNDVDGMGDACDPDDDNDGLPDVSEEQLGSDPFDPDTDKDELIDGDELLPGTDTDGDGIINVLDPDSDNDGLLDGPEVHDGLCTNPLDPDSDDDLLKDGLEVSVGTDPCNPDTDGDGIIDGKDVEFLESAIEGLPPEAFSQGGAGLLTAMLVELEAIEAMVAAGKTAKATAKLALLRQRVDGCGTTADMNDWIVECEAQKEIRALIDLLIANLGT